MTKTWLAIPAGGDTVRLVPTEGVGPDFFVKLADYQKAADELEALKLERHQLRNELTAARLEGERLRGALVVAQRYLHEREFPVDHHVRSTVDEALSPRIERATDEPSEGPASLVGALQDVVHTDTGPVRAGHSVKSEAPLGSREREAYEAELKRLRDSLAQRT